MLNIQGMSRRGSLSHLSRYPRSRVLAAVPDAAALLPSIAADGAPALICVSKNGGISCTDEKGDRVSERRMQELQRLLQPIAEAPAIASSSDETSPQMGAREPGNPQLSQQVYSGSAPPGNRSALSQSQPPGEARRGAMTVASKPPPGNQDPSSSASSGISTLNGPDPTPLRATARAPGNVSPDSQPAPASAKPSGGRGTLPPPGNVDPSAVLRDGEFSGVDFSIASAAPRGKDTGSTKVVQITNAKGLIPGNVPPEVGDIVHLLEAANQRAVGSLAVRVYPGNVPPGEPADTVPLSSVTLELSPGDGGVRGAGPDQAVSMQLVPGNVPPDVQGVLDFLASAEARARGAA